jgi:hypothetical protein
MKRFIVGMVALATTVVLSLMLSIGVIAGCPWSEIAIH